MSIGRSDRRERQHGQVPLRERQNRRERKGDGGSGERYRIQVRERREGQIRNDENGRSERQVRDR